MLKKQRKGQGIVEYAGALVVATVIVGLIVSIAPMQMGNIYNSVGNSIQNYFTNAVANIGTTPGTTTP